MTIEAAGYIITNETAIWGFGDTKEAAWANFLDELSAAGVQIVEREFDDMPSEIRTEAQLDMEFSIEPATADLIATVQSRGGAIG